MTSYSLTLVCTEKALYICNRSKHWGNLCPLHFIVGMTMAYAICPDQITLDFIATCYHWVPKKSTFKVHCDCMCAEKHKSQIHKRSHWLSATTWWNRWQGIKRKWKCMEMILQCYNFANMHCQCNMLHVLKTIKLIHFSPLTQHSNILPATSQQTIHIAYKNVHQFKQMLFCSNKWNKTTRKKHMICLHFRWS